MDRVACVAYTASEAVERRRDMIEEEGEMECAGRAFGPVGPVRIARLCWKTVV